MVIDCDKTRLGEEERGGVMEINQIRYFLEVASSQHVTKSAEKLHVAQPALTKAIHKLEEELGVPLFVPQGRNIILTEYGKYLCSRLTGILDDLDSVPEQLKIMAQLENETVHLNVLAASYLVTEAIIAYKKDHAHLNFQMRQNNESALYDVGITTRLFYQSDETQKDHQVVLSEKIFLAVPAGHALAQNDSVELSWAAEEGFISLMGSRQMRWICDQFCSHAGFSAKIIFESDNPAAVKNMIAANMGIGFWPEFTWGRMESEKVRLLPIREPVCQRDIIMDYKQNKVDCREVRDFYDFLTDYFQKIKQESIFEKI